MSHVQVRLLNLDVQQAHAQSTVQLIGRKQIGASDPPQVLGAAHRILQYLMGLATAEMRREVLPEAFESPENGVAEEQYEASSEGNDAETEQLSTTPLQLLQVCVKLELVFSKGVSILMFSSTTAMQGLLLWLWLSPEANICGHEQCTVLSGPCYLPAHTKLCSGVEAMAHQLGVHWWPCH